MTIEHGIFRPINGFKVSDVNKLREGIRIGDKLRYPRVAQDQNGNFVERWEKVCVTGIYPNLVTVESPRGGASRFKTITYIDILTDPRVTMNL